MLKYIVTGVIIIILLVLIFSVNYAFKNIILGTKKTKEDAFDILTKRGVYDVKRFDNIDFEELEVISEEGYKLKGYYIDKKTNSKKVVIIVHGYTANHYIATQFSDMFLEEDFNVLLIDVRAHGESEGKYATYGFYEKKDLDLWVELMRDRLGKDAVIGLHGQSMGAATVLMYGGSYDKANFIIADCPYSTGRGVVKYQFKEVAKVPFFPLYQFTNLKIRFLCKFSMDDISPRDKIKYKKVPVLFIHGTGDKLIPYTMSEEMFKCKVGDHNKLLLIDGADHVCAYAENKEKYISTVKEFLNEVGVIEISRL